MKQLVNAVFVQSQAKIRCERRLPRAGDITVRVGTTVAPNHVVARIPKQVQFHVVPGSELLGVPPAAVTDYLLVEIGEKVGPGTPLLQRKRLFGGQTIESPIEGEVSAVQNGRIILQSTTGLIELRAMIQGRVANFMGNHSVILETQGTLIQGVWSSGVETYGPLKITADSPGTPLHPSDLQNQKDHILVTGTIRDEALLEQAATANVRGLIVGTMPAHLCDTASRLRLPLILTDGIGDHHMAPLIFERLQAQEQQEASLLVTPGASNRPEIIITHNVPPGRLQPPIYTPLEKGKTVRLLRAPYKGEIAQVDQLFSAARTIDTGIKAYGAMVRLANGQTVFVPYANMETIL
jgi:hypothetical protein